MNKTDIHADNSSSWLRTKVRVETGKVRLLRMEILHKVSSLLISNSYNLTNVAHKRLSALLSKVSTQTHHLDMAEIVHHI